MKWMTLFNRKIAAVGLIAFGVLLAISPAGTRKSGVLSPLEIAATITSESDHVEAEQVAAWLVDKRPDLLIVDIRADEAYQQYHLPGAINLPLTRLFEAESLERLRGNQLIVLYSNGGTHAAQAWVLLRQLGIPSYVMLGGLNYWAEAILNPSPPGDLAADAELLRYQFQQAASGYFKGGVEISTSDSTSTAPKVQPTVNFTRKKKAAGGC